MDNTINDEYDLIVLGSGLKEYILSAIMAKREKKVLHIFGDHSASITSLEDLYERFGMGMPPEDLGLSEEWKIDTIPKLLMANGSLTNLLVLTGITPYLEFKYVEGSYFYRQDRIHKVPCDEIGVTATGLIDHFGIAKNRFRILLEWAMNFDMENPETYNSVIDNPQTESMRKVYDHFEVDDNTEDLIGRAICLYLNNDYIHNQSAEEGIKRMQCYIKSVDQNRKSPYVYPVRGLGELPKRFAQLSEENGGAYMLKQNIDGIEYDDGKVIGVKVQEQMVRCKAVICDPGYAPNKVKKVGSVVRAICLLIHPIPNTCEALSAQIIIPQGQFNRNHDIYVCCVSYNHSVASTPNFIAVVSTTVETDNPHEELQPGLQLLGEIEQIFYTESDLFEPIEDGVESGIFISTSYDATTHCDTTGRDVLDIYRRYMGAEFDFGQEQLNIQVLQDIIRLNLKDFQCDICCDDEAKIIAELHPCKHKVCYNCSKETFKIGNGKCFFDKLDVDWIRLYEPIDDVTAIMMGTQERREIQASLIFTFEIL